LTSRCAYALANRFHSRIHLIFKGSFGLGG
jgi:hypothetical protein